MTDPTSPNLPSDRNRCDNCGDRLITETEKDDGICASCDTRWCGTRWCGTR